MKCDCPGCVRERKGLGGYQPCSKSPKLSNPPQNKGNIMTTTVIVQAHCASDKEVIVTIEGLNDGDGNDTVKVLQDGETYQNVVFDDRVISICEQYKAD